MAESLKGKTVKGLLWSGTEKFAYEAVQFIIGIILARLLTPHDYGTVGLLTVFITVSQLFIDGKMTTALIQKKNRTEVDFHTVFFFNLGMSLTLYAIIFFIAPSVARTYDIDELTPLLRTLALVLVITPFSSIQITQLTIKLDFRTISLVSLPSALISGMIGIFMAYKGFGAYSIVIQHVSMVLVRGVIVNILSDYRIKLMFSKESFKDLFSFSYKLVLASSLDRIYRAVYTMVIGKVFNPATLGLYTRGNQFSSMTSGILGDIFNRVTLPVMSTVQDEREKLQLVFRKYVVVATSVICPALVLLAVIAKPLILFLLTEKWIEAVPIMQLLCFAYMTNHISSINRNLLYAKKRSDLALKLEIIKKFIAFAIFFASLTFGIVGVCIGQVIYGVIAAFLNAFYTKRFIGVGIWTQTLDYYKVIFIAFLSAILPYFLMGLLKSVVLQIILATILYLVIYMLINALLNTYPYKEAKSYIGKKYHHYKR